MFMSTAPGWVYSPPPHTWRPANAHSQNGFDLAFVTLYVVYASLRLHGVWNDRTSIVGVAVVIQKLIFVPSDEFQAHGLAQQGTLGTDHWLCYAIADTRLNSTGLTPLHSRQYSFFRVSLSSRLATTCSSCALHFPLLAAVQKT